MKNYNYVYLITNIINEKKYVGKHSTDNLKDGYFGSGVILKKAILKHGRENFKIELIEYCENEELLNKKEIFWIKKLKCVEEGYNLTKGGEGCVGIVFTDEQRERHKLAMNKPEIKKKISERTKKAMKRPEVDKKFREAMNEIHNRPEIKERFSKRMKEWNKNNSKWRKKHNEFLSELWNTDERKEYAKQRAIEQFKDPKQREMAAERARISKNRAMTYEVTFPTGKKEIVKNLPDFCFEHNLNVRCMRLVANDKQKQHKGFSCKKI